MNLDKVYRYGRSETRAQTCWSPCLIQLFFCFSFLPVTSMVAQHVTPLQLGDLNDSSYYHLAKIGENEYWACGEMGIITQFDTLGNFQALPIQTDGYNILKVERFGDDVILATDNGRLMKYNLLAKTLIKRDYPGYGNRCFYDFVILPNGKMLLCGGRTGISKGLKEIPNGFIAVTDTSLREPKRIWKSNRKFVWSLLLQNDGSLIAAVFNGMNSSLICSNDFQHWEKNKRIKGLVHEIKRIDSTGALSYVGTGGVHYGKNGIFNIDGVHHVLVNSGGCLWSQERNATHQAVCGQSGQVLLFDQFHPYATIRMPSTFALYDLKFISDRKLLIVGHGKCAYMVEIQ